MTITVTEKQHWKEQIEKRIERRIDALVVGQKPTYLADVRREARAKAMAHLGVSEIDERLTEINHTERMLRVEYCELERKRTAILTGQPIEFVASCHYYTEETADKTIRIAIEVSEREILSAEPAGRKILILRDELELLLDTVWISTSSKQIRELWKSVAELVEDEPTTLQQAALTTEPVEDSE